MTTLTDRSADQDDSASIGTGRELTPEDVLILGWLALMSLCHLTFFAYPDWTARSLVLLALLPVGLWRWVELLRRRDTAAIAYGVFVAILTVASVVSSEPSLSLVGNSYSSQTVLFFAALGCVWAVGRTSSEAVRNLSGPVLAATLAVHLLAALVQLTVDVQSGPLVGSPGRASGLATNPVYFGSLMMVGAVWAGYRALDHDAVRWLLMVATASFAISLSGSRAALVATVVVLAALTIRRRTTMSGLKLGAAVIVGLVIAEVFSATLTESNSSLERAGSASTGGRWTAWQLGWEAFLERPLLGWGPNRFRHAIDRRLPDDFARQIDAPLAWDWTDPHNLVVGTAVGAGLLGLIGLLAFVVLAVRSASGELLAVTAAIGLTWLFQPLVIVTAPIAALLFGLAYSGARSERLPGTVRDQVALVVGLVMVLAVMTIDLRIATSDGVAEAADGWEWYWNDPSVADHFADRYTEAVFAGRPEYIPVALQWSARAASYQPDRARYWAALGGRRLIFGDVEGSREAIDLAFELQPNSPDAWKMELVYASEVGDDELYELAQRRVCELTFDVC